MYQDLDVDLDQQILLERCMEWWNRETKGLQRGDAHLRNPKQEQRTSHSKNSLREWLQTREITEEAYMRYTPRETQPTLHRWLVHKQKETLER